MTHYRTFDAITLSTEHFEKVNEISKSWQVPLYTVQSACSGNLTVQILFANSRSPAFMTLHYMGDFQVTSKNFNKSQGTTNFINPYHPYQQNFQNTE